MDIQTAYNAAHVKAHGYYPKRLLTDQEAAFLREVVRYMTPSHDRAYWRTVTAFAGGATVAMILLLVFIQL